MVGNDLAISQYDRQGTDMLHFGCILNYNNHTEKKNNYKKAEIIFLKKALQGCS